MGSELKHLFGGLNPVFEFQNAQKVECAQLDDPCAVAHDHATKHGRCLTQQDAALVTQQAVWLLDHLDCGSFAQVWLAKVGNIRPCRIEDLIGLGESNLDMRAMGLQPFDDILGTQTSRVRCRFMQHRIGDNDIRLYTQKVIE